jgi:hypothetical protein
MTHWAGENYNMLCLIKGYMVNLRGSIVMRWVVSGLFMKSALRTRLSKLSQSKPEEMFINGKMCVTLGGSLPIILWVLVGWLLLEVPQLSPMEEWSDGMME